MNNFLKSQKGIRNEITFKKIKIMYSVTLAFLTFIYIAFKVDRSIFDIISLLTPLIFITIDLSEKFIKKKLKFT